MTTKISRKKVTAPSIFGADDLDQSSEIRGADLIRETTVPVDNAQFRLIDKTLIDPDPTQPRTVFDQVALDELQTSIEKSGQIQSIIVIPAEKGRFMIVIGERRWRAVCQSDSVTHVKAEIQSAHTDVIDKALFQYAENDQVEKLSLIDKIAFIDQLRQDGNFNDTQLATVLNKSKSYISIIRKAGQLPDHVHELLVKHGIDDHHIAASLARLFNKSGDDAEEIINAYFQRIGDYETQGERREAAKNLSSSPTKPLRPKRFTISYTPKRLDQISAHIQAHDTLKAQDKTHALELLDRIKTDQAELDTLLTDTADGNATK